MRNELIGYLSIPVIVAGGMSVWKLLSPEQGILPSLPGLKWNKEADEPKYSKDEMAAYDADEAADAEEAEGDGDSSYSDSGADDER